MDAAIDIILKGIYERRKMNTSFTKQEFKELIFYFAQKKFILLYAVNVMFKQMESLWVPPWGQYYPEYLR